LWNILGNEIKTIIECAKCDRAIANREVGRWVLAVVSVSAGILLEIGNLPERIPSRRRERQLHAVIAS
jgi:hypothetical protein